MTNSSPAVSWIPSNGDEIEFTRNGRRYCVRLTRDASTDTAKSGNVYLHLFGYRIRRDTRDSFGERHAYCVTANDVHALA